MEWEAICCGTAPTLLPPPPPSPPPPPQTYKLASTSCPTGFALAATEAECRAAAEALGLGGNEFQVGDGNPGGDAKCSAQDWAFGGTVLWNPEGDDDSLDDSNRILCVASSGSASAPCTLCTDLAQPFSAMTPIFSLPPLWLFGEYTCQDTLDWLNGGDATMDCAAGRMEWEVKCCGTAPTLLLPPPSPPPPPQTYKLASISCPTGFAMAATEAECRAAAEALGLGGNGFQAGDGNPDGDAKCRAQDWAFGGTVLWNPAGDDDSLDDSNRILCVASS